MLGWLTHESTLLFITFVLIVVYIGENINWPGNFKYSVQCYGQWYMVLWVIAALFVRVKEQIGHWIIICSMGLGLFPTFFYCPPEIPLGIFLGMVLGYIGAISFQQLAKTFVPFFDKDEGKPLIDQTGLPWRKKKRVCFQLKVKDFEPEPEVRGLKVKRQFDMAPSNPGVMLPIALALVACVIVICLLFLYYLAR
jgi:hypothetical protein